MDSGAQFSIDDDGKGGRRLVLSGPYLVSTVGEVDRELRAVDGEFSGVDLSGITEIDTVGAWTACHLASQHNAEIEGASDRAERLIKAIDAGEDEKPIRAPREVIFRRVPGAIGQMVVEFGQGVASLLAFIGQIIMGFASLIRHPRRFRVKALVRQLELVGVSALGIIGLMSFLIGIVVAQQGAVQLQQFGAEIYTINLTGRLTMRELGVLMTAIMVAGRSGSAFAAQLGTMKLTEEVDAMRTIGISPMEALIIPRILAAVIMMPLLGFYSACMGILGGAFIADATLDIPFFTFLSRIQEVVPMYDLYVGLVKAPVFGMIVAIAGCYQGMQVEGNSEQVGLRTTKAVVQAIFMVIVLDAFFAVFFTKIGWA
ncbi:MlaE family lipid ABC transporter permease subunit [Altererythrobacter confluentis]|uniref:MlaE family lipid ABC transporter permease subunit n=1 Tax=Allopontixanthobacter confluentis TaxID=1849021 RepID=A0A6L7GBR2_9SPHN|nr:ABC transporter permease [Allopontixanthobacter confluentis]MXP13389.1 MlaE family lipid ABC transporter permease subunit [Allopontixanthobacter confluentis]